MREEFISMPTNITQLRQILQYYEDTGLPDCCGSMDVVHVKWSACQHVRQAIIIKPRVRGAIPVLHFSVLLISIAVIWPSTVHNFVQGMIRRLLRTILTFIMFERVGIRMPFGSVTLQMAEWIMIEVHN
jgi:hypothetical protein